MVSPYKPHRQTTKVIDMSHPSIEVWGISGPPSNRAHPSIGNRPCLDASRTAEEVLCRAGLGQTFPESPIVHASSIFPSITR